MTNTQTICITVALLGFFVAASCTDKGKNQRAINHAFDAACQRVGGVTVPSIEPGMVHCVQPIDGILETAP